MPDFFFLSNAQPYPLLWAQHDPWMTALSMLPSVAASWVALALLMRREISRTALVVGGVLVGAGIGATHTGAAAPCAWGVAVR